MGLAEPKRKKKLAASHHAPSTWSKEAPSSSLGFKLMSSMGWSPGHGLGQNLQGEKDNVKYSLKDDLLGVGAKKEYGGGLWRGTSEMDDLYKRLEIGSGAKGDADEKEVVVEPVLEKVKLRGGWEMKFQVGQTYTSSFSRTESETEGSTPVAMAVDGQSAKVDEQESKKRKREGEEGKKKKKLKKSKSDTEVEKESSLTAEPALSTMAEVKPTTKKSKKDKAGKDKSKKEKKSKKESKEQSPEEIGTAVEVVVEEKKEKRKDKKVKKDKKEKERAEDKADKPKSKKEKGGRSKKPKDKATPETAVSSAPWTKGSSHETTPIHQNGNDSDEPSKSSRHMHRARFMAMKRASVLNPEALREILGVSA